MTQDAQKRRVRQTREEAAAHLSQSTGIPLERAKEMLEQAIERTLSWAAEHPDDMEILGTKYLYEGEL